MSSWIWRYTSLVYYYIIVRVEFGLYLKVKFNITLTLDCIWKSVCIAIKQITKFILNLIAIPLVCQRVPLKVELKYF